MLDSQSQNGEVLNSIVDRMNGFVYRCRNDRDYSMMFMRGDVMLLTGHEADSFTGPQRKSYAAMTHPDDLDRVYAAVDAGIAGRFNWDVDYRIIGAGGKVRWVHETGGGVFEGDELIYLEGIVIDHEDRKRVDLGNVALLTGISDKARNLLGDTVPIIEILRTLRVLAINARLEAGRAGPSGAGFGFVAREVSRLAEETSVLAERIAVTAGKLQTMLNEERKP